MLHIILQCTRTNDFAKQAINSFKEIVIKNGIKKYISINENILKKLTNELNDFDGELIIQKGKLKKPRDNLKFLLNFSNSEYIMFCHDDDLFSPKMATSILHLLKKYKPNTLCSRVTYINENNELFPNRQYKSIKKIKFIKKFDVLFSYFSPFCRSLVYPTLVYKRKKLLNYFNSCKNLGQHEDVKIIYSFAGKGRMIINYESDLYFYRKHNQNSQNVNFISRLRLMVWLKKINLNIFLKSLFLTFSKFQYVVFCKKYKNSPFLVKKIIYFIRNSLVYLRKGNSLFRFRKYINYRKINF